MTATGTSSGDELGGGEFDNDEPAQSLQAARRSKDNNPKVGNVGSKRTTATVSVLTSEEPMLMCHQQMGLCVSKVEVDDAVQEGKESKKSLRERSKSDLLFKGENAKQWDQLICALLDWAGTTNDPFGMNEHPDLMEQLQELWNKFFEDIKIDIADHPTVKKKVVVSGIWMYYQTNSAD